MANDELFRAYQKALTTNSKMTQRAIKALVAECAKLPPSKAAELLVDKYAEYVHAFGQVAADVAREYYQAQRDEEELDEAYVAQVPSAKLGYDPADDVGSLFKRGESLNLLAGIAEQRVITRADSTIGYNVRRDPAKPRWAIVPHAGACGWCLLVAGNGWSYSEKSVYAQRHPNCKCAVAVDFNQQSPSLASYDPSAYQKLYADARSAVEADANSQWYAMDKDDRDDYDRPGRKGKDVYMTKRVTRMMDGMSGHSPMTAEDKALYDAWKGGRQ